MNRLDEFIKELLRKAEEQTAAKVNEQLKAQFYNNAQEFNSAQPVDNTLTPLGGDVYKTLNDGLENTVLYGGVTKNVGPYELIQQDDSLSPQEKADRIHEIAEQRNKEIQKEHLIKQGKNYAGAALKIGSAFIPMGGPGALAARGVGKVLAPLGKKASAVVGKKIAQTMTKEVADGIVSTPVAATGDVLLNDVEVLPAMRDNAIFNLGQGVLAGGIKGGLIKKMAASELKNIKSSDTLPARQQRKLQDKGKQYYENYIKGTTVNRNDVGKIKFDELGNDSITTENVNIIPKLPRQIKTGKLQDRGFSYDTNANQVKNTTTIQNEFDGKRYNYEIDNNIMNGSTFEKASKTEGVEDWLKKFLRKNRSIL